MFVQSGRMNQVDVLQKNKYDNKFADACTSYPTVLNTVFLKDYEFEDDEKFLKHTSSQKSSYTSAFVLCSNYEILHIAVKPNSIEKMNTYTFDDEVATLIEGNLNDNIQMLEIGGYLYVFSPTSAHRINLSEETSKFKKLTKYSVQGHKIVTGCGVFKWEKTQFWVSTEQSIFVYSADSDGSLKQVQKIDGFTDQTISAIQYDYKNSIFYVATLDNLHIFTPSKSDTRATYELHGICS